MNFQETKLFDIVVPPEHQPIDTALFWCFDPRFWETLLKVIDYFNLKPGEFDVIDIAGGSKGFSSPSNEHDQPFLLSQLKIALTLHKARRIILMVHSDCGAYGYPKFPSWDEERNFFHLELRKSKDEIQRSLGIDLSAVEIVLAIARFDGVYRIA